MCRWWIGTIWCRRGARRGPANDTHRRPRLSSGNWTGNCRPASVNARHSDPERARSGYPKTVVPVAVGAARVVLIVVPRAVSQHAPRSPHRRQNTPDSRPVRFLPAARAGGPSPLHPPRDSEFQKAEIRANFGDKSGLTETRRRGHGGPGSTGSGRRSERRLE